MAEHAGGDVVAVEVVDVDEQATQCALPLVLLGRRRTELTALDHELPEAREQVGGVHDRLGVEELVAGVVVSQLAQHEYVEEVGEERDDRHRRQHECPPGVHAEAQRLQVAHSNLALISNLYFNDKIK